MAKLLGKAAKCVCSDEISRFPFEGGLVLVLETLLHGCLENLGWLTKGTLRWNGIFLLQILPSGGSLKVCYFGIASCPSKFYARLGWSRAFPSRCSYKSVACRGNLLLLLW